MTTMRSAGRVDRLRGGDWQEAEMATLSILSALAEPTRLAAMRLVWEKDELCLCEIIETLDISQSRASRHMAVLAKAGLVLDRRDAQWVRYRKNNKLSASHRALVKSVMSTLSSLTVINKKGKHHEKH